MTTDNKNTTLRSATVMAVVAQPNLIKENIFSLHIFI